MPARRKGHKLEKRQYCIAISLATLSIARVLNYTWTLINWMNMVVHTYIHTYIKSRSPQGFSTTIYNYTVFETGMNRPR